MKAVLVAAGVVLLVASTASAQWGDYAAPVVVGPVPTVTYYAPPATYYAPLRRRRTMHRPRCIRVCAGGLAASVLRAGSGGGCRPGLRRTEGVCARVNRCGTLCGPSSRRGSGSCSLNCVRRATSAGACRAADGAAPDENVAGPFRFARQWARCTDPARASDGSVGQSDGDHSPLPLAHLVKPSAGAYNRRMMNSNPAPKYRLWYIWTISLTAALGGLLFGYDFVVINGAKPFYEQCFRLATSFQVGWATSCALVGCLAGALLAGGLSDRFGRKRLLILAGGLFVVTGVGVAFAADTSAISAFHLFVLFRVLGGMGIGLASNISPMYIAEIAPAERRGKLVSLNQLTIVIGILVAQVINCGINWIGDGMDRRHLAVAPAAAPADQSEFVKRLVAKYGPRYGENTISEAAVGKFLAAHGKRPDNQAVLDFLKPYKVNLLPVTWNWPGGDCLPGARRGLAMDVRGGDVSGVVFLPRHVFRAGKPSLAGEERKIAAGAVRAGQDRRRRVRRARSRADPGDARQ